MGFEAPPDVTVRLTPLAEVTPCGATVTRPEKVQPDVPQNPDVMGVVAPELSPLYCDTAGNDMQRKARIRSPVFLISQYHPRA